MKKHQIINQNNLSYLKEIADNTADACITDPPYGMDIIGCKWDKDVPPVELWQEVYRVLKPGAFVVSFCAPQYYHRMATKIEDAGFRSLDMVFWIVTTKMAKLNRLKPAHEPIYIGQKPFEGTRIENFQKWGCGVIDTESTRVPWEGKPPTGWIKGGIKRRAFGGEVSKAAHQEIKETEDANPNGRYPSNVIGYLDEPEYQKYFYAPRVTREERGEYNNHPTPKPIDLMRYLCKIYSPKNGLVLDPFCGSGSTGIGAMLEDRYFVGIDENQHYCEIAERRFEDHVNILPEHLFGYDTDAVE